MVKSKSALLTYLAIFYSLETKFTKCYCLNAILSKEPHTMFDRKALLGLFLGSLIIYKLLKKITHLLIFISLLLILESNDASTPTPSECPTLSASNSWQFSPFSNSELNDFILYSILFDILTAIRKSLMYYNDMLYLGAKSFVREKEYCRRYVTSS